jgi:hypothetical protein
MEKTYKLSSNITNEITTLINDFYVKIDAVAGKLVFLEIIEGISCSQDQFLNEFMIVHQELHNGSINKIRHFILMKAGKINKDLKNKIPLLDIINTFPTDVEQDYWNLIHYLYILLESSLSDKQDEIVNTLVQEIDKRATKHMEMEIACQAKIEHDKQIAEQRIVRQKDTEIPDISEMMKHMDNNPEIMEMFSQMSGADMSSDSINKALKQAMTDNPEMTNMFTSVMSTMKNAESMENIDIMGMVHQFMPSLDMTCHTNIVLINKLYKDIVFIFSTDDDANSTIKDRVSAKITIYNDLIANNKITPSELASCMMRISTNEEMKDYITNMEKAEVSMDIIISLVLEFVPKEMVEKFGDIEAIKEMVSGLGIGDISKIIEMFSGASAPVEEEPLTEAQELELEKFYDQNF